MIPLYWLERKVKVRKAHTDLANEMEPLTLCALLDVKATLAIFLKDVKHCEYEAYEKFEQFKRKIKPLSLKIFNLKRHDIDLPDAVTFYRYLNSANLSTQKK